MARKLLCTIITFPLEGHGDMTVESEIKPECQSEIITNFLMDLMLESAGKKAARVKKIADQNRPEKNVYKITVGYNVADDVCHFNHDFESHAMFLGALGNIISKLPVPA